MKAPGTKHQALVLRMGQSPTLEVLLLAGLLLSGCISQGEIVEDFQRNRQVSYEMLSRSGADKTGGGLELLSGELSTTQALEYAFRYNKDVQKAKVKLLEAKAQMTEAIATALPTASFTGSALRNDNSGFIEQKETYQLQLLVRQPLYLGGLMGAAIDAAAVFTYQVQQELRQVMQAVEFQVRQQYLAALLNAELVEVSQQNLSNAEEHLHETEKKLKYGAGTQFDVLRARVRVSAIEARLIQRKNEYRQALARLLNILGVAQLSQIELTDKLDWAKIEVSPDGCLLQAMKNHPDLLIGEALVRLARDNIISEQTGNRPKVYLQGLYQRDYPGFSANFSFDGGDDSGGNGTGGSLGGKEWERTMSGGIMVEWPFFDGFSTDAKVAQAKALLQEQQILLRQKEQKAQLEVTEAVLDLQSSEKLVLSQLGNVTNAEEALRLAQVSFRAGAGTSLDVIVAETALAQARADYSQAVHNYQLARLEISRAIGTLGESAIPTVTVTDPNQADQDEVERND